MSASWALQQAIFATLCASDGIKDVVGDPPRVFDAPPRGVAFPYVVIGDDTESDWSTATEAGSEHALAVHVWSRADGHREAKLVADAVRDALDGAALSVTGQALIDIRHRDTNFIRESDGETTHAVLQFRAVMEPA
ncbi:MAG TPA: DUF3168 domain-containing protein [Rhizomicrobium sp.]|nr:DUF3168 domain-containing protein [Rhizomicrobium sp.]